MVLRGGIKKRRRSYEHIMKTLLLQNQQIIIQQQNMMFMVMKQFSPGASNIMFAPPQSHQQHQQQPQQQQQQQQQPQQQQQQQHHHHHQQQQQQQQHLQEELDAYLTPATSEQDTLAAGTMLEGDGLMTNNILYNPSTDFGSITPYKSASQPQQSDGSGAGAGGDACHSSQPQPYETPSYYSSGCESLTTPRIEQQRQQTTANISQNVVKNLDNAFKSPTKPKISVQILSDTATRQMKQNNKAKIIQSMNISEFLRQVHNADQE